MNTPPERPTQPELTYLALCYAAGELSALDASLFEERLAGDSAAREALVEALRLAQVAQGEPVTRPDSLRKEAVRERVFPTLLSRLFPRRPYRGHPMAWTTFGGAVAASVLVLGNLELDPPQSHSSQQQHSGSGLPAQLVIGEGQQVVEQDRFHLQPLDKEQDLQPILGLNHRLNPMGMQEYGPVREALVPITPQQRLPKAVPPQPMPAATEGGRVAVPGQLQPKG